MNSSFNFILDRAYVIASLTGNHLQTAKDLYHYHIQFENKHYIEVHSKEELLSALEKIESEIDETSGREYKILCVTGKIAIQELPENFV